MVVIKISRTAVINPPGATPVLTVEQIWEGLVEKCRKPQGFVPLMEDCQILREDDNGLTRLLTFKNGWGPPGGKAVEDIRYYSPMRVDFAMKEGGERISNIVSTDCEDESILYMTFTIEWPHPHVQEGSEEAQEKYVQCSMLCKQIIMTTIDTIRTMVKEGKLY